MAIPDDAIYFPGWRPLDEEEPFPSGTSLVAIRDRLKYAGWAPDGQTPEHGYVVSETSNPKYLGVTYMSALARGMNCDFYPYARDPLGRSKRSLSSPNYSKPLPLP